MPAQARRAGTVTRSRGVRLMARQPISEAELVARYGPHLNQAPPGGWNAGVDPDREVKTHCCFCGQQCGIVLKVKDDEVVGFEPWYEFPFNEGKLCPKGVKRYLQNAHPDRLLAPLERDPGRPEGFRPVSWDHALDRTVAEIRRIQADARQRRVRDVVGRLTRQREVVPDRQVRPPRARHGEPRLQRPALHGVGRRGQQAGAGDRPGVEPVERHPPRRGGVRHRGEHRRVRADHHELDLAGPRQRGQTHRRRSAGHADGPHRRSVPRAAAGHRQRAARRDAARDHPARMARPRLHPRPHERLRRRRRGGARPHAGVGRAGHRRTRGAYRAGRRVVGDVEDRDASARTGPGAPVQGSRERVGRDQPRPGHGQVRQAGVRGDHHHRAGQWAGRTRARPQVRPVARQPRHHQPRASRLRRVGVGL